MLVTRDQVKTKLSIKGNSRDDAIDVVVNAVSIALAQHCGHVDPETKSLSLLEYDADVTVDRVQRFSVEANQSYIRLPGMPIIGVSEVVAARTIAALDTETALVEETDWVLAGGDIDRLSSGAPGPWPFFYGSRGGWVRVTYSCGFWTGDTENVPEGATQLPWDIAEAALIQAVHEAENLSKFGVKSTEVGQMLVAEVRDGLLDRVRQLLQPYERARGIG